MKSQFPFLKDGGEMGKLTREYDWSLSAIGAPDTWPQTLKTTVSIILHARFPMFLWWGPDQIQFYNDAYIPSMGKEGKHPHALGEKGENTWPEIWPTIKPLIDDVLEGKDSVWLEDQLIPINRNGSLEDVYWTFSYSAVLNEDGNPEGVLVTCLETTRKIEATRQANAAAEEMRHSLIEQAPMATCLWVGENMVIEMANDRMLGYWGKDRSAIGQPLADAVPELKGQPYLDILANVFHSGKTHSQTEAPVNLIVDGEMKPFYFNFTYKPFRNSSGEVYGIMNMAVDVTEQVMSRQKLEEAEQSMRGAVELADLGVWSIDVATRGLTYSDRMIEWFGYDPSASNFTGAIQIIDEADQARVNDAVDRALDPAHDGTFDEIYTVIHPVTGSKRILHGLGKTVFDASGKPLRMQGTAQDITLQREHLLDLEKQVQNRTEELAAAFEKLQMSNAELEAANEQLRDSNEDLAQYAYVASHDLQEPLRKISTYSSIIENSGILPAELRHPSEKIRQSSQRMSLLIRDLLEFSTLLKPDRLAITVDLDKIARAVIEDFEISVKETEAVIEIINLPTIEAMGLQMNQLFYNLLSNAIKFRKKDGPLAVTIDSELMTETQARDYIPKLLAGVNYYHIKISDNGIGFDDQYAERIFEVFKRLHGRDSYPGSGIGLALCRRIVTNHHGVLFAESTSGEGSVFHVILPDKQDSQAENTTAPSVLENDSAAINTLTI